MGETKPKVTADQPGEIVKEARIILSEVSNLTIPDSYEQGELKSLLADSVGLFTWGNIKLTKELLSFGRLLKVVGVVGVGCDHIDLANATERGIIVANGPGSNSEAVAEYTILLMLALTRNFIRGQSDIRDKRWFTADYYTGNELTGATLGLSGTRKHWPEGGCFGAWFWNECYCFRSVCISPTY